MKLIHIADTHLGLAAFSIGEVHQNLDNEKNSSEFFEVGRFEGPDDTAGGCG